MSAVDLLAVLGAIALVVACVALYATAVRLLGAARRLEQAATAFEATAAPLLADLAAHSADAAAEVARVEQLLDVSSGIARRVDGTTAVAYRAITTPAIKGVALAEGTRRAARRLGSRR